MSAESADRTQRLAAALRAAASRAAEGVNGGVALVFATASGSANDLRLRAASGFAVADDARESAAALLPQVREALAEEGVSKAEGFEKLGERAAGGLEYPPGSEHRVDRVWTVQPAPPEQPGRVYAGVERAGLFVSDDGGAHWRGVDALNSHRTTQWWQPGGAGR